MFLVYLVIGALQIFYDDDDDRLHDTRHSHASSSSCDCRQRHPGHTQCEVKDPYVVIKCVNYGRRAFVCGRSCDMELVTRQYERPGHQQRLLQTFTEDVFFYFQLTCVHSALEISGRCALQIYLLTYLITDFFVTPAVDNYASEQFVLKFLINAWVL